MRGFSSLGCPGAASDKRHFGLDVIFHARNIGEKGERSEEGDLGMFGRCREVGWRGLKVGDSEHLHERLDVPCVSLNWMLGFHPRAASVATTREKARADPFAHLLAENRGILRGYVAFVGCFSPQD